MTMSEIFQLEGDDSILIEEQSYCSRQFYRGDYSIDLSAIRKAVMGKVFMGGQGTVTDHVAGGQPVITSIDLPLAADSLALYLGNGSVISILSLNGQRPGFLKLLSEMEAHSIQVEKK
jgi:hypothetical protein